MVGLNIFYDSKQINVHSNYKLTLETGSDNKRLPLMKSSLVCDYLLRCFLGGDFYSSKIMHL